jgi:hypothetical protein
VPGRYEHNRDPQLAALLHEVTVEGWGNDTVGDLDEDGFHASLLIVEPAEQQEVTEAFDRAIPIGSWIVTEDQQGFVTVDQYPTPQAARHAFDHLPDLDGPGEEDGTITPAGPLGSRYAVALAGSLPRLRRRPGPRDRDAPGSDGRRPLLAGCLVHQRPRQPPPPQPRAVTGCRDRCRTGHGHGGGGAGRSPARWLRPASAGVLGSRRTSPPPGNSRDRLGPATAPTYLRIPTTADPAVYSPATRAHRPVGANPAEESR